MNDNKTGCNRFAGRNVWRRPIIKGGDVVGGICQGETVIHNGKHDGVPYWTVKGVFDGDTFDVVNRNKRKMRVRLWGIDAPEHGQLGFRSARRALRSFLTGGPLQIQEVGPDKYGRVVCKVAAGTIESVSAEMVKAGWAWWYKTYAPMEWDLRRLERDARAARVGLWQEEKPMPPWIYRHGRKQK